MGVVDKLVDLKNKLIPSPIVVIITGSGIIGVGGVGLLLLYGGGGATFSTLVNFFWPLLLSTAFFLAAVVLLFKISPPPASDAVSDLAGGDLIDYVAGPAVGYQHHPHHHQFYSSIGEEPSEKQLQPDPPAEEDKK